MLWYREDLGTLPIYSVDVRGKDFSRAEKWFDSTVLNNRASFDPDSSPPSLVINHFSEKDVAMYRCRVDFKYAQTRNAKVNLTIIVPPQNITITDEQNVPMKFIVGPYIESSDVTVNCQVCGGQPLPYITWYKDSQLLNNSISSVLKDGGPCVLSTVTVKRLQRTDLNSQLTCEGRNNNLRPPLTAFVQIDMNFSPVDVRIVADEQPLTAQRKYDLVCEAIGSRPHAKLTWWKNNSRLEKTKDSISSDGNITISTLTFVPTKEDKGKYLICRAENPVIPGGKVLETSWKLQIHYTPETRIILGTSLKPDLIKEGMDVYFDCIVNAYPPVYKVKWKKNNETLHHNVQKGVIISNQSLVLQGVSRTNAGNYTCIGYNTEGDGVSQSLYLNVMYAPFCKPNQTRVYGIAKNEIVNITCEVDANPTDLYFQWKFNNSADSEELSAELVNKSGTTISVVSHMPVLEVDYGTLLCSATNKVGRQRVPCVFHVIAAGKPDTVSNCTVNNISINSFSVRCLEGFNGGLLQNFSILVREVQENQEMLNISSVKPWFTVSGLQPGTSYKIAILSTNAKGSSEPYQLEIVTQGKRIPVVIANVKIPAEMQQRNFHVTTTMGVIIGTVISALTVACIVASIFKIQCSKSSSNSIRIKNHSSNGTEADKTFPSPVHDNSASADVCIAVDFNMDVDDKNPDIIPQSSGDMDKHGDYVKKKQHISTIENRYKLDQNFLQYSNTPIGYSGYCTLRTGVVPLQDLCHLSTNTTTIHGDLEYFTSCSGTVPKHSWPSYSGSIAGVQNHQCVYQTLPSMSHQQIQTQISVPPTILERSVSSNSIIVNKQESTV